MRHTSLPQKHEVGWQGILFIGPPKREEASKTKWSNIGGMQNITTHCLLVGWRLREFSIMRATTVVPIRHILESLHHPQPPTPLKTNNSTATGFVYDNIHQKRSKAWDMRYHWLRDCQTQQQFNIFWQPGTDKDGVYYTKHHATTVHRDKRPKYVRDRLIQFLTRRCPARVCWCITMTSHRR